VVWLVTTKPYRLSILLVRRCRQRVDIAATLSVGRLLRRGRRMPTGLSIATPLCRY